MPASEKEKHWKEFSLPSFHLLARARRVATLHKLGSIPLVWRHITYIEWTPWRNKSRSTFGRQRPVYEKREQHRGSVWQPPDNIQCLQILFKAHGGQCALKRINLRSAECVCSYYGLRVCYKQTNKINKNAYKSLLFWAVQCLLKNVFSAQTTWSRYFYRTTVEYEKIETKTWIDVKLCRGYLVSQRQTDMLLPNNYFQAKPSSYTPRQCLDIYHKPPKTIKPLKWCLVDTIGIL